MRRSSSEYRDWSLEEWCAHVRYLGVTSLSEWAVKSRSTYNRALILGLQRDVASALGWLPKIENGGLMAMTDEEFVERFMSKGVRSITDMWKAAQHWCELLRREGRLETVAAMLGLSYTNEFHPPDDLSYYLERCNRVGDVTAWAQLDRNAADAARRNGLIEQVRELAPKRPRRGYLSSGGYCQSLPELALTRVLEANGHEYVTQMPYPFTFPRGKRHSCKSDTYVTKFGAYIEVWSAPETDTSPHFVDYLIRRRFKTDMCARLNLRLLHIEGVILFTVGVEAYIEHVHAVLTDAGLSLSARIDPWAALAAPEPCEEAGDGA